MFEEILTGKTDAIKRIAQAIRASLLKHCPQLEEKIYGGDKVKLALYSIGDINNVFFGIQAGDTDCKLFLHRYEQVVSKYYRMEGKGKHTRHIKFRTTGDLNEMELASLIKQVVRG
jgi:hypothetical protein